MDTNYHYCFFCDKWLSKEQVNQIDLGDNNFGYYCSTCRKECGEPPQIFRCPNHKKIVLKIWGTLEGENKEKIFHSKCPLEKQEQKQPNKQTDYNMIIKGAAVGLCFITVLIGITWYLLKKEKD